MEFLGFVGCRVGLRHEILVHGVIYGVVKYFHDEYVRANVFLVFTTFVGYGIFNCTTRPYRFAKFPFVTISNDRHFVGHVLYSFFHRKLVFSSYRRMEMGLRMVKVMRFFVVRGQSPPFCAS